MYIKAELVAKRTYLKDNKYCIIQTYFKHSQSQHIPCCSPVSFSYKQADCRLHAPFQRQLIPGHHLFETPCNLSPTVTKTCAAGRWQGQAQSQQRKWLGIIRLITAPALRACEMGDHATRKEEIWKKIPFAELIIRGQICFSTRDTDTCMEIRGHTQGSHVVRLGSDTPSSAS